MMKSVSNVQCPLIHRHVLIIIVNCLCSILNCSRWIRWRVKGIVAAKLGWKDLIIASRLNNRLTKVIFPKA